MNIKHLFFGLAAIAALAGCSSDDNLDGGKGNLVSDGEARYLTVTISGNNDGTRAGGDQMTKQDPDGNATYEEGLTSENSVKNVRFYFFYSDGSAAAVKADGKSYFDCTPADADQKMPNIEKKLAATVVINTKQGDKLPAKMVAVLNAQKVEFTGKDNTVNLDKNLSLSELQKAIGTLYQTDEGFVMSSSVYSDGTNKKCEVEDLSSYLKTTETEAEENPVDVYVERVAAKVRVKTTMKEDKKGLYLVTDKEGKPVTYGDGKQVYAKFLGWAVTNLADRTYLFKEVTPTWDSSEWGFTWNYPTYFRSYWALNPNDLARTYPYTWNSDKYNEFNNANTENSKAVCQYILEDAADNADGYKSVYDPATAKSNRTQVVIKAQLCDENGDALTLSEWGGVLFAGEDDVLIPMVNQLTKSLYYVSGTDNEGNNIYTSITKDDVTLSYSSTEADKNIQDGASRYSCYLQLSSTGKAKTWYDSNQTKLTDAQIESLLNNVPAAKVWNEGMTYYYTDIKHLGYDADKKKAFYEDANGTYGAYGVVRNHIYDIDITGFKGLGTPVYDGDEYIIPQDTPEPTYSYLAARINILSWRVVNNSVVLGE